jgi:hypothetical protein
MKLEFSRKIFEKRLIYQVSSKCVYWESSFFPCGRTDGTTDVTKLIVDFRNFANAPKNDMAQDECAAFTNAPSSLRIT